MTISPPTGIEVHGVRRTFGDVHAVRDATFTALPGRVTALVGPNGSGKTTLMLMLASLLAPDAGSIRIAGHDPVTDAGAVRRALGWMPDMLGSWASLTVRTTLETTARLYRLPQEAARSRAAEMIELTGLGALADQPTRVLSRGQKQRLSLARALVHDPAVLILDEPASGLDPAARVDLRNLVRGLATQGRTVLVSSHVLAELDELADDAVFLEAGATVSVDRLTAARSAAREWRIRALDRGPLREALRATGDGGTGFREDHLGVVVPLADEAAAADLLRRLVEAGAHITAFAPAVGELERTFLELGPDTEGGAR